MEGNYPWNMALFLQIIVDFFLWKNAKRSFLIYLDYDVFHLTKTELVTSA